MRAITKLPATVYRVVQLVQCRMRLSGALLVFPALLPRFGEPSAILIAEITCPQTQHTVAAAPAKPVSPPNGLRSSIDHNLHQAREAVKPVVRPSLAVRFREMWQSQVRMSPVVDRARTPAPIATRSGDLPRSS